MPNHLLLLLLLPIAGMAHSVPSPEIIDSFANSIGSVQQALKEQRLELEKKLIRTDSPYQLGHFSAWPFNDCWGFGHALYEISSLGKKVSSDLETEHAEFARIGSPPPDARRRRIDKELEQILKRGLVTPKRSDKGTDKSYQQVPKINPITLYPGYQQQQPIWLYGGRFGGYRRWN